MCIKLTLINIFLCHPLLKACKFGKDLVILRKICLRVFTINVRFKEIFFFTIIVVYKLKSNKTASKLKINISLKITKTI